jgi:hypothetical protein
MSTVHHQSLDFDGVPAKGTFRFVHVRIMKNAYQSFYKALQNNGHLLHTAPPLEVLMSLQCLDIMIIVVVKAVMGFQQTGTRFAHWCPIFSSFSRNSHRHHGCHRPCHRAGRPCFPLPPKVLWRGKKPFTKILVCVAEEGGAA